MRSAGLAFVQRVDDGHVITQLVHTGPVADAGNGDRAGPELVLDGLRHPDVGIQRAAGEEDGGGHGLMAIAAEAPALGDGDGAAAAHQVGAVHELADRQRTTRDAGIAGGEGHVLHRQAIGAHHQVGGAVGGAVGVQEQAGNGDIHAVDDQRRPGLLAGAGLDVLRQGQRACAGDDHGVEAAKQADLAACAVVRPRCCKSRG